MARKPAAVPNTPPPRESAPPAGADTSGAGLGMLRPLVLTIASKREGFRRAGRAWSVAPTTVDVHDFTPEQLEQLADENGKMLTITGD